MKEYRGPGVYKVNVSFHGSTTVTVEAASLEEALRKAEDEADEFDTLMEAEAESWECVAATGADSDLLGPQGALTGVEEAFWMLTGKIPPEASRRLAEEAARQLEEVGA